MSSETTAALEDIARTLEDKRAHALAERLDEIAVSRDYMEFMALALVEFERRHAESSVRDELEFEFAELESRVQNPAHRPSLARLYGALVAAEELVEPAWIDELFVAMDEFFEGHGAELALDDFGGTAQMRRLLRHVFWGGVALTCLPFVHGEEDLRAELLRHAAVGAEANLRLAAASSADEGRARELLADLRLEPLDLDGLEQRAAELEAARTSLSEARAHLPNFRLPPDPGLQGS